LIGLARQLSGIPAPTAARPNEAPDAVVDLDISQQDEDLIAFEAENIARKGREEEKIAQRGSYSEQPGKQNAGSMPNSTSVDDFARHDRRQDSNTSTGSGADHRPLRSRSSWQTPAQMNDTELVEANTHLLTRLKPFMANPRAESIVRAFFYNEHASREHITKTDASGHFTFRSALDFIPTHVRVLAGEDARLSVTEEVIVTSATGVSLISDIDDTVKHSAISAGAREIFRNAFIRNFDDLTIEGVREWYATMHDMGVKLHYVSNSPWQMYPILTTFFKMAHLPKGSFHLKQYSGMLQGIFEPVAERKKSSLDKLMRDFPDRKFILVGDSGEADLEVYTDTALDNPGRILGIFIRDVTTSVKTGYFDASYSPTGLGGMQPSPRMHARQSSSDSIFAMSRRFQRPDDTRDDEADLKLAIAASLKDMEDETKRARRAIGHDDTSRTSMNDRKDPTVPPRLPQRPSASMSSTNMPLTASPEHDLIDFNDLSWTEQAPSARTSSKTSEKALPSGARSTLSPPPPPKPASLRSPSPNMARGSTTENGSKAPPPRPRKPSSAVRTPGFTVQTEQNTTHQPSPLSQVTRQASVVSPRPPLPTRRTYREYAKEKITKALPTSTSWQMGDLPLGSPKIRPSGGSRVNSTPTSPLAGPMRTARSFEDLNLPEASLPQPAPPPPPRRNRSSFSLTPSRRHSHARSGSWDEDGMSSPGAGENVPRKEYLWKQRLARAQALLERNGVTVRTWKVGSDIADVCVRLVEMELRSQAEKAKRDGR
jgi:phosphatidate phosphatase APP1